MQTCSLTLSTLSHLEIRDITASIESLLESTDQNEGVAIITVQHTTAGLLINEYEEGLRDDLLDFLETHAPVTKDYHHNTSADPNGHAHLKASLLKTTETIPFVKNKLQLGTWQRVLFIECDGPRKREVKITLL